MTISQILDEAKIELISLDSHLIDILEIKKPSSVESAKQFAKIISKLSPILGNLIEFSTVDLLNKHDWQGLGKWVRQDPGFPDNLFKSDYVTPNPGIEIKAWFPFATEITARFRDSVTIFSQDNINMALIAWLPEHVIWGKPQIINVLVVPGRSVAEARDAHYHQPPDYLVFEPEDTATRTANLQQTNTNGYKLQDDKCDINAARAVVEQWGQNAKCYSPTREYQQRLKALQAAFVYRLDTNYAKIDRIKHKDIDKFKEKVLDTGFNGMTIREWAAILSTKDSSKLDRALETLLQSF